MWRKNRIEGGRTMPETELIKIEGKPAVVFDIIERLGKLHGEMTLKDLMERGIRVYRKPLTPESLAEYLMGGKRQ